MVLHQVLGSSEEAKRSFLERKGLTAAEMAEAFRRVPAGLPVSAPVAAPAPFAPSEVIEPRRDSCYNLFSALGNDSAPWF